MSDLNNCFKEAVCIEAQRIFDSCSDRDCIYELPVTLTPESPPITDDMDVVRARCIEVQPTCILVDPVPFKCGYYSVDITYRFLISAEAYKKGFCKTASVTYLCGTALWNKRVILYGSTGSSKVYTSDDDLESPVPSTCDSAFANCASPASMPKATVRVLDPIALDAKFLCVPGNMPDVGVCQPGFKPCCPPCCPPPRPRPFEDEVPEGEDEDRRPPRPPFPPRPEFRRILTVSLGLFSIVQLSRPVSIVIPAYDYCIPCKDCTTSSTSEAPCDVFDKIAFPSEQFFPQPSREGAKYSSCCEPESDSGAVVSETTGKPINPCGCRDKCDR